MQYPLTTHYGATHMLDFLEKNPDISDVKLMIAKKQEDIRVLRSYLHKNFPSQKWRKHKKYGKSIRFYKLDGQNDESVRVWFKHKGKEYSEKVGLKRADKITDKKALEALKKFKAKITGRELLGRVEPHKITFGALWAEYGEEKQRLDSWGNTSKMYEKHFKEELHDRVVMSIDHKLINMFQNFLLEDEYSPGSINQMVEHLLRALRWGVEAGLIEYMPVRKYAKLKIERHYDRYLSHSEIEQLKNVLREAKEWDLLRFVQLSLAFGARTSSILNFCGRHVLGTDTVVFWDAKRKQEYKISINEATDDEEVKKLVADANRDFKKLVGGEISPMNRETVYNRLMKYINPLFNVDVPKHLRVRLHTFRHTFASLHIENGVAIYRVQKMLNHSSVKTTERYLHD